MACTFVLNYNNKKRYHRTSLVECIIYGSFFQNKICPQVRWLGDFSSKCQVSHASRRALHCKHNGTILTYLLSSYKQLFEEETVGYLRSPWMTFLLVSETCNWVIIHWRAIWRWGKILAFCAGHRGSWPGRASEKVVPAPIYESLGTGWEFH